MSIAAFSVFLISTSTLKAQTDFEYHQMALLAQKQFDYVGACKMMNEAIKLTPRNPEYYVDRGHIYLGLERHDNAFDDFNKALRLDSMWVEPWVGRCLYYMYTQELDSALKDAHIAYILAEDKYSEARAGSIVGEIFLSMGEESSAIRYLEKSLLLDTTNTRGFKKAALVSIRQKEFDKAEGLLLKALKLDAYDLETLINLAYVYNSKKDYKQSIEYCNLALVLDPTHPLALSNRAYAFLNTDQKDRALIDINQSIRNNRYNSLAHLYKGQILLMMNENRTKVCKCFERADELDTGEYGKIDIEELIANNCPDHD